MVAENVGVARSTETETATETEQVCGLSVVLPCLNEAETLAACVTKAQSSMNDLGIDGEVVVADNGSSDGSGELAERAGARVVHEPRRGYGSAYLAGFAAARGRFILMGDADDSYDFGEIPRFIEPLRDGADMVIGNRLPNVRPGAMPWLHRYVGNPILTGLLNLFFGSGVSDAHCGMRAFRRDLLPALNLRTTGMEFASEHVIRSSKLGLDIREVEIEYHPRRGESKLASFADGWRHLRFLLVHSPTWLFLVPGLAMVVIGLAMGLVVLTGVNVLGREWDVHALIGSALLVIVGSQVVQFGVFGRAYAAYYLDEHDVLFDRLRARLRLEHGLIAGAIVLLGGLAICAVVTGIWIDRGFGALSEEKLAVAGATLVILGIQIVFGSFFLSVLGLRRRPRGSDELPAAFGDPARDQSQ
jgi:glycosyltransferase involved in cell wall biosynthesis